MNVFTALLAAALLTNQVRAADIIFPGERVATEQPEPSESEPGSPQAKPSRTQQRISPPPPQLVFKEVPKCARNPSGVCSQVDTVDYPTELIRRALGNANDAALSEITRGDDLIANLSLGNRFGGSIHDDNTLINESPVCDASEEIIYPTMAMNDNNEWLYVANLDSMTQGIRVEKCLLEGLPCKVVEAGTVCRQKYIYRKLLAIDANQNLEASNFRIPSTCVCYIKHDFLGTRFKDHVRNSTKPSGDRKRRGRFARRRRQRRQAGDNELGFSGGEVEGLSGSPLDNTVPAASSEQGTAQQSIETEETLNPSDTIGDLTSRFAGEIIVESNPIIVEKKPPKSAGSRN